MQNWYQRLCVAWSFKSKVNVVSEGRERTHFKSPFPEIIIQERDEAMTVSSMSRQGSWGMALKRGSGPSCRGCFLGNKLEQWKPE